MASVTILLPTGRIVSGDVYEKQTKDSAGNELVYKRGPNAGKPRDQWFFGVVIPKAGEQHWSQTPWGQQIWAAGHAFKPNAANMRDFAWKIADGDDPAMHVDKEGQPRERKNIRGHWYVRLSSGFAPFVASLVGRQQAEPDPTPGLIYPGCYVQVQITCDANGDHQKPGVYLNHKVVCLIGFGERIEGAQQDVTKIGFGGPMPAGASVAPPGVTALPVPAAAAPLPVPAAAAAAPLPVPAAAAAPLPVPAAAAAPLPVPNPAFLQVPAVPTLTAKAPPGATYQQFRDAGWTDDQMRQQGYLA